MKVLELATPIFSLHNLKNLWVLLNVESDFPFLFLCYLRGIELGRYLHRFILCPDVP